MKATPAIHDPNTYVVVERWETRDDLNAHGKAPHMKVWREYSAPLKAGADRDRDHQRRQGGYHHGHDPEKWTAGFPIDHAQKDRP